MPKNMDTVSSTWQRALIKLTNCLSLFLLSQVNGQNVVKVGHRQVVNMIRQGGNSLMVKVVMVTRNPDMEEGSRKKSKGLLHLGGWYHEWMLVTVSLTTSVFFSASSPPVPQQSKRLSTPAIALRSKSMTSELEEMGKKQAQIKYRGVEMKGITKEWKSGLLGRCRQKLKKKRRRKKNVLDGNGLR